MAEQGGWIIYRFPDEKELNLFTEQENGESEIVLGHFSENKFTPHKGTIGQWNGEQLPCHLKKKAVVETSRSHYENSIAVAKEKITNHHFNKVVLSRAKEFEKIESPFDTIKQLSDTYPHALVYLLWFEDVGMWCGASPELLLEKTKDQYKTVALAGTRKLDSDVPWEDKERLEQGIVNEYIVDLLQGLNAQKIESTPVRESINGTLKHLKNDILFQFDGEMNEVRNALHPTPAVAGTPLKKALDFIKSEEPYDRELYAGFLQLPSTKATKVYVNLRCMQVVEGASYLYAGGGITEGSDPAKEWEETEAKMEVLSKVLSKN
ncbi:MAG: chorismate-binding protein [Flavobacteriales bacterium]|nr:chorismate-binding protein [Flavobacteriales bacterium]